MLAFLDLEGDGARAILEFPSVLGALDPLGTGSVDREGCCRLVRELVGMFANRDARAGAGLNRPPVRRGVAEIPGDVGRAHGKDVLDTDGERAREVLWADALFEGLIVEAALVALDRLVRLELERRARLLGRIVRCIRNLDFGRDGICSWRRLVAVAEREGDGETARDEEQEAGDDRGDNSRSWSRRRPRPERFAQNSEVVPGHLGAGLVAEVLTDAQSSIEVAVCGRGVLCAEREGSELMTSPPHARDVAECVSGAQRQP